MSDMSTEPELELVPESEVPEEPELETFPCDLCDFVARSSAGLGAHRRTHDNEPKPVLKPSGSVKFRCTRYPKLVLAPNGRRIGQFENGILETANPALISFCRKLEDVEEVS